MSRRGRYVCVDADAPEAAGRCDRGGEVRRRSELLPQMIYAGDRLVPSGWLVCAQHMDRVNPQDRAFRPSLDPKPVRDPRPDFDVPAPEAAPGLLDTTFILDESTLS